MSTAGHTDCLDALDRLFNKHAGDKLWHATVLSTSWERSPEGPDPWYIIAERDPRARHQALIGNRINLRERGAVEGRYFGDHEHHLHAFQDAGDSAYRWLQESPLRQLADRVIPPRSPLYYADCWLGVLYLLAWEAGSPILRAREREVCEMEGSLLNPNDTKSYHVAYAVLERDVFTASLEAVRLLRKMAVDAATPPGAGKPKRKADPRGKWIYEQVCKDGLRRVPLPTILIRFNRLCSEKGWEEISSIQGLRYVAKKYAEDRGLPLPPPRQDAE